MRFRMALMQPVFVKTLPVALALFIAGGCGPAARSKPAGIPGAYTGEGVFRASRGTMDVKAQLELDADGRYRLLFLEPQPLMLMGAEEGQWTQQDGAVHLDPSPGEIAERDSTFGKLSGAASRSARSKTLVIEGAGLVLRDDPITLTFRRK